MTVKEPVEPYADLPAVSEPAWVERVAGLVSVLREGAEPLVVIGDESSARPVVVRAARLRLVPARHRVERPVVRFERREQHLYGELTGAERFGGRFPISPQEDAAIVAAGWRHPGPGDGDTYIRWWPDDVATEPYLPWAEARAAADAAARALRVLGGT